MNNQAEDVLLPSIVSTDQYPELAPFWEAARSETLVLPKCTACRRFHWYPRANCPFCFGDIEWLPATGEAVVYSFSVSKHVAPAYAIAYVTLAEGVTMLSNVVDCDFDALAIGQKVRVAFAATKGGTPMPVFRPA